MKKKKNVKKNVNKNEAIASGRCDDAASIRALGVSRFIEGEKYLAFNPYAGAPVPACWLVTKKLVTKKLVTEDEKEVCRRQVVELVNKEGKVVVRDIHLTASEAYDFVGEMVV